jgi:capsular polysaccharide transport system permease protein
VNSVTRHISAGPPYSEETAPGFADSALSRFWDALRRPMADVRLQFLVLVFVPTIVASVYYGLIASDQYVSHAKYIVRGVQSQHAGGIGALLNTFGISRTADDTSAIESFMQSRAAIEKVAAIINLREVYGRPEADFVSRYPQFWRKDSFESLYEKTQEFITVLQDQSTGITTLEVAAFRPEDARRIAVALLNLAEEMVNQMNARAQSDAVSEAQREVIRARDDVVQTQKDLTAFRNKEFLVDPVRFAGLLLDAIGQLSLEQAQTRAQIDQTSRLSPTNPSLTSLQARADALEQKIIDERQKLAGNDSALADKVSTYERLTLLRDLADKRYSNALVSLRSAQMEAQRQQIYVEEIVAPNMPDESTKPERLRSILAVFVMSFAIFAVFWIINVGSKDHAQ